MGNTSARPHPRQRNKKQVHWKAADRPAPPGKPQLVSETEVTPDVITIRWDRPAKDGGSPIIGYLVEHRRTGSPHWVRATPLLVPFPELKLSGLEPGWRYQFRVSAENAVGMSYPSELSEPLTVTLQRSAITSPRFTQDLSDTVALENEKVEFAAHFLGQPAPKICWFKDGFEIFSSRRTRILTESDRSVLTIHQSALSDEGEIKCTATNKAGHASTKAKLTLEAPPSIRLPRQYEDGLLFEIGEVMRLKVSVAGLPAPLVFWSHDGETIKNDERYEIESSDKSSTMKVGEAKRTDRGEYQIKAVNKLGQDTASFLVTVTDKPSQPGKARVVMTLGKSVTLAWNTPEDDGGCKIGNYIIEYYRVGWDVWLKAATSRQLSAVLGDLIEGSEYKFRIKAESPYGVSEPSQESEVVFIPDPRRGILAAPARSRSHPRDLPLAQDRPPALPERKNKQRSQSSTRVEAPPKRPERTKTKSPSMTPEMSPNVIRRDVAINKAIFDRASITRDLAYGSPEIRIRKADDEAAVLRRERSRSRSPSPFVAKRSTIQIIDNRRPRSPSPLIKSRSPSPVTISKSPSPVVVKSRSPTPVTSFRKSPTPSSKSNRKRSLRSSKENLAGSSEFMLVLLPNGDRGQRYSDGELNFDDSLIPPPLSLSAPELGAEPPPFIGLKYSASSSELLHERAMSRFYEAAEAEELELKRRRLDEKNDGTEQRGPPGAIPKIQINNEDVGMERAPSLRRRHSGVVTSPHQLAWTHRRHSLRSSVDNPEIAESKLRKFPLSAEEKREIMMNRKRSRSEEMEEEEFERVRSRTGKDPPRAKLERRNNLDVVDLKRWEEEINEKEEEYEESLSEEDESESDDERVYDQVFTDDEDHTYHPGAMRKVNSDPFEILTEPKKLPDPNFVPKPILKHKLDDEKDEAITTPPSIGSVNEKASILTGPPTRRGSSPTAHSQVRNLSAIASISGLAAASVVIPKAILAKKIDDEEAKIVVDHYADIVRSYGQKRRNDGDSPSSIGRDRNVRLEGGSPATETNYLAKEQGKAISENGPNLRNDSDSSSQRSSSPARLNRMINRRKGSPTVLNREVFGRGRSSKSPKGRPRSPHRKSSSPISTTTMIDSSAQTKRSPSPTATRRIRPPMMKEIMTQTSACLDTVVAPFKRKPQSELDRCAEITVRTTVDYVTDLAMFAVACWLYVFSNELLAVPVLVVMVFRQLQDAARKRLPKWMMPKPKDS